MIIYRATAPNGKSYIGQTIKTLSQRRRSHESQTKYGSDYPFNRAIRKYGNKIKWEVIAKADSIAALNALEAMYIALYNTMIPHGYNAKTGGDSSIPCAETKMKISTANKARYAALSDEEKAAWSAKITGRKLSPETRANMSAAAKVRFARMTSEERAAFSAKMSLMHTGKKRSPEACRRMADAQTGKKRSPEHRAAISAAVKAAWAAKSPEEMAAFSAKVSAGKKVSRRG